MNKSLREIIRDWKPTDEAAKAVAEDETAFPIMRSLAVELLKIRSALKAALEHVLELEEAWRAGAIHDRDGKGGERSNRNADVRVLLSEALASQPTPKGADK